MKLEALLANVPAEKRISGALSGGVDLVAHGRTLDAWLASAAGTVSARLHGGSMSRRLDAELGLSGARLLRALFGGEDRVPIRCAAADVELRAGQARSRTLLLETERTHVSGVGTVNLKSESIRSAADAVAGAARPARAAQVDPAPGSARQQGSPRTGRRDTLAARAQLPRSQPVVSRCSGDPHPSPGAWPPRPRRRPRQRIGAAARPGRHRPAACAAAPARAGSVRPATAAVAAPHQVDVARQPGPPAAAA